jgi:hypothetical protein
VIGPHGRPLRPARSQAQYMMPSKSTQQWQSLQISGNPSAVHIPVFPTHVPQ